MKKKRIVSIICCLALLASLVSGSSGIGTGHPAKVEAKSKYTVSTAEINSFFGKSAIIGHSVGLGLKNYFNTKESGYLGRPTMLVWGCYSFINDFCSVTKYMIHYNGKPMRARDAVKSCGAKHVFINMGMNDFNTSRDQIMEHYFRYIREIKATNPKVDIYILAATPTRIPKGRLNNTEINKLNENMKKLAKQRKDMYYIDINTPLKDSSGVLKAGYASDGFVHLTYDAYRVWTYVMVKFVRQMLKEHKKAKSKVKKAAVKLTEHALNKAREAVANLDKSSFKKNLRKRLKVIRKRIREREEAESIPVSGSAMTVRTESPEAMMLLNKATTMPDIVTSSAATIDPNALTDEEKEEAEDFRQARVENLAITKNLEEKVVLTWDEQDGAEKYAVLRSENKTTGYKEIGKTSKLKYKDKSAGKKNTYYYRVQASMTIKGKTFTGKLSKRRKTYVYPKDPMTVMCGECFMVGMQKFKSVFGSKPFVAKIGMNTYTLLHSNYFDYNGQSVTGIERIAYYNPDRVFFLVGGNESAWTTTGWTMNNYTKVRELLRKINPHIQIVLIKIAPCGYSSPENIPSVSQRASFNNAYKSFADKYKDVFFCPATDALDDGSSHLSRSYDAGDGCHWNDSGSSVVANKIRDWSKEVFHNW